MRIRKVTVTGLFGMFDHSIPFNLAERVTIIHGPNGYGKTVVLSMLDGLLRGNYALMRRVPFTNFEVEYDDGRVLGVEKLPSQQRPIEHPRRRPLPYQHQLVVFERNKEAIQRYNLDSEKEMHREREMVHFAHLIGEVLPFLERTETLTWRTPETGELLSIEEVIDRWGDLLPGRLEEMRNRVAPPWLRELRERVGVRLIQAQRLQEYPSGERTTYRVPERPIFTALKYSNEIAKEIQGVLAKYAARSQELDRTFPARLLDQDKTPWTALSPQEVTARLAELEGERRRLIELGILDQEGQLTQAPQEVIETKKDVLSVYVNDVREKFKVLEELAQKVGLLARILNSRFLCKKTQIRPDKGFAFTSSIGTEISPTDLSSGEQHELILFYELLFKVKKDWLVLIDEPEMSLHIAWQNKFLEDLQEIVRLSAIDVVFATHSPMIIGEHWDLAVELKPPHTPIP